MAVSMSPPVIPRDQVSMRHGLGGCAFMPILRESWHLHDEKVESPQFP